MRANGKICYLEMPARDTETSAAFYRDVFGWTTRTRGDGQLAFDDGLGEVSGSWRTDRSPIDADFLYIMVADADRTCDLVARHGGVVVERPDAGAREIIGRFRDPAGNVFSIYQDRGLAS